jgi:hypothetical protein
MIIYVQVYMLDSCISFRCGGDFQIGASKCWMVIESYMKLCCCVFDDPGLIEGPVPSLQ